MAKHPFAKSRAGVTYPTDYIGAAIEKLDQAEQAVNDLLEAGFSQQDIVLYSNEEASEIFQENDNRFLKTLKDAVAGVASDEGLFAIQYTAEAKAGHHLIAVYAPKSELVDRAYAVLKNHGAHAIRFFGRWTVTTLP